MQKKIKNSAFTDVFFFYTNIHNLKKVFQDFNPLNGILFDTKQFFSIYKKG